MNGKTKKPRSHIHTHVCTYNYPYACVQFTYKQQTFKHRHIIIRMYMYICSMHTPLRTSACNTNYTLSVSNQELIIHNQGVYTASLLSNQGHLIMERGLDAERLHRQPYYDCLWDSGWERLYRQPSGAPDGLGVYNSLSASFACSFSCLHLNVKSNVCLCLCLCEYLDLTVSYCHSSQHKPTSHTSLHLFLVKKNVCIRVDTHTSIVRPHTLVA